MIKITIIYDNTICKTGLQADWGFSAVIDLNGHRVLFDAGADGNILLKNMKVCEIDPLSIDTVFMSHHHFDHTGGLAAFLHENSEVQVYVPASLRGIRHAKEIHHLAEACKLFEGVHSSGELQNIEQCMFIESKAGLIVVAGCSHPGIDEILDKAKIHGHIHLLLGGFHGFKDFDLLQDIDFVCPTHCTKHIKEIAKMYPKKYLEGGAGRVMLLPMNKESYV